MYVQAQNKPLLAQGFAGFKADQKTIQKQGTTKVVWALHKSQIQGIWIKGQETVDNTRDKRE